MTTHRRVGWGYFFFTTPAFSSPPLVRWRKPDKERNERTREKAGGRRQPSQASQPPFLKYIFEKKV
jgi:hypothetical protein